MAYQFSFPQSSYNPNQFGQPAGTNFLTPPDAGILPATPGYSFGNFKSYGSPYEVSSAQGVGFNAEAMKGYTPPLATATDTSPSMWQSFKDMIPSGFLSTTDTKTNIKTDGWGSTALGVGKGLMDAYLGMQMYGIAKDTLENNKAQFAQNYAAQRTTTNNALEDRQRSRINSSTTGSYESVGDYMKKHAVA